LSSAFYFLKALSPEVRKRTKVVLLDRQERVGGWCTSVRIPLPDAGKDEKGKGTVAVEFLSGGQD